MCSIDDGEDGLWLQRPHEVKARKQHSCYECGAKIEPGETYSYSAWVSYAHELWAHHVCMKCHAAGQWLVVVCGGFLFGGMWDELVEHWHEEIDYRSVGLARVLKAHENRFRYPMRRSITGRMVYGREVTADQIRTWTDQALAKVPAGGRAR